MHRHRLCRQHAFDFIGRLERPHTRDGDKHLLATIFVRLTRGEPAGLSRRRYKSVVEPVAV